jgi:predicted negative regulator of RcsB-dependent stress response
MDIIIIAIVIATLGYVAWKFWPKADVNNDGKVDAADVKTVADVNNDGKVDVADAVEVVKKATTRAKKVVTKNVTKRTKK